MQCVPRKMTDHGEQTQLFLMKDGPCRETSTHEVNEGLRGSRVKFEEAAEDILIVLINDIYL